MKHVTAHVGHSREVTAVLYISDRMNDHGVGRRRQATLMLYFSTVGPTAAKRNIALLVVSLSEHWLWSYDHSNAPFVGGMEQVAEHTLPASHLVASRACSHQQVS